MESDEKILAQQFRGYRTTTDWFNIAQMSVTSALDIMDVKMIYCMNGISTKLSLLLHLSKNQTLIL